MQKLTQNQSFAFKKQNPSLWRESPEDFALRQNSKRKQEIESKNLNSS